ncbi:uridine kinase family protein [Litorihabitans aurantiacus]|uniref:Uridine kinase n=1 Tax=Litorihabitans aurantiacus TaxID=1930061 RepID=A0AA38CW57_9MICO|nr:hypothetical protein [Litorihabitans aurantiacus]GMA33280.1 hypothetical protein GCM10025875_32720 [Litorihabitans aurantiacus]
MPEGDGLVELALGTPPGEPGHGPWRRTAVADLAQELLAPALEAQASRCVLAIDGRGGAGKSTLAARLLAAVPAATLVSTDDLAWHEPMFGWAPLALEVLAPYRAGEDVRLRPPAWERQGRDGVIEVSRTSPLLILEGTGAAQRALDAHLDAVVWVASDRERATQLGLARDIASGVNGDEAASRAFWDEWMTHEDAFFDEDRPWERADLVVAGTRPGVGGSADAGDSGDDAAPVEEDVLVASP